MWVIPAYDGLVLLAYNKAKRLAISQKEARLKTL